MSDHDEDGHAVSATIGRDEAAWHFESKGNHRNFGFAYDPTIDCPLKIGVSTGAYISTVSSQSALVIIDMQNYFLSDAMGRARGAGHVAAENLIRYAIPAARKAGIRIVWLNWGLTDEDMETMPPAVSRCFGFVGRAGHHLDQHVVLDRHGFLRTDRTYGGLGSEMGRVTISAAEGGPKEMDAGRLLYRGSWNAALFPPLAPHYRPGEGDAWIHKNRMSGMWGSDSLLQKYLQHNRLTTLFFGGVNTDQCVGSTLMDAFSLGYNCILLKDGCGTTSPQYAHDAWEFNCENSFGFVTTCQSLWEAVSHQLSRDGSSQPS
ncbi:uncharacterized protein PV09_08925 [Verruconis gallopava]|uniref:Isochorismatase-like domain-containing protein n=1 Tax=Verruconis gallopava TaxID=253628 RepID=A0A0D1XAX6_9PEZI|nr:uncharacterized protein PV09_08925 [Verruconis gallopava]KIV99380.1 hypothetical protein PV09_08925 [Verruconis gallopava]